MRGSKRERERGWEGESERGRERNEMYRLLRGLLEEGSRNEDPRDCDDDSNGSNGSKGVVAHGARVDVGSSLVYPDGDAGVLLSGVRG